LNKETTDRIFLQSVLLSLDQRPGQAISSIIIRFIYVATCKTIYSSKTSSQYKKWRIATGKLRKDLAVIKSSTTQN